VWNLARKVTHARKRNPWADCDELLHRCRGPRRNHLCQFLWLPHTGFRHGGGSNFGLLHWLASSPLQHFRTTVILRVLLRFEQIDDDDVCYCCVAPFQNGTCNSASSTSNSVDLYWQSTRAASYYQITYRQLSGTMRLLNVSSTSVTVTSLTAGYLYTFYLQSFGDGGPSQKSNCSYSTCKLTFNFRNSKHWLLNSGRSRIMASSPSSPSPLSTILPFTPISHE